MKAKVRFLAFVVIALAFSGARPLRAQEAIGQLDLLYPQFAHPEADAAAAIKRNDLRFVTTNRQRTIVPGVEDYPRLRKIYRTKYIRQPFRIFATRSQNFSFNIRAEAYAASYNRVLVEHLLAHQRGKKR